MSKDLFEEMSEQEMNAEIANWAVEHMENELNHEYADAMANYPVVSEIVPGTILRLTKQNLTEFHQQMRTMILEEGRGMFEYLEAIQFFCKLKETIFGVDGKEGDKDFLSAVMDEIKKYGKDHTTGRGVKFELAETGTKYDYSENPEWVAIEERLKAVQAEKKALEEKLKKIPAGSTLVDESTGETLIGPSKTSKSSFKIILGKS
jgi:hypothetical protein